MLHAGRHGEIHFIAPLVPLAQVFVAAWRVEVVYTADLCIGTDLVEVLHGQRRVLTDPVDLHRAGDGPAVDADADAVGAVGAESLVAHVVLECLCVEVAEGECNLAPHLLHRVVLRAGRDGVGLGVVSPGGSAQRLAVFVRVHTLDFKEVFVPGGIRLAEGDDIRLVAWDPVAAVHALLVDGAVGHAHGLQLVEFIRHLDAVAVQLHIELLVGLLYVEVQHDQLIAERDERDAHGEDLCLRFLPVVAGLCFQLHAQIEADIKEHGAQHLHVSALFRLPSVTEVEEAVKLRVQAEVQHGAHGGELGRDQAEAEFHDKAEPGADQAEEIDADVHIGLLRLRRAGLHRPLEDLEVDRPALAVAVGEGRTEHNTQPERRLHGDLEADGAQVQRIRREVLVQDIVFPEGHVLRFFLDEDGVLFLHTAAQ